MERDGEEVGGGRTRESSTCLKFWTPLLARKRAYFPSNNFRFEISNVTGIASITDRTGSCEYSLATERSAFIYNEGN